MHTLLSLKATGGSLREDQVLRLSMEKKKKKGTSATESRPNSDMIIDQRRECRVAARELIRHQPGFPVLAHVVLTDASRFSKLLRWASIIRTWLTSRRVKYRRTRDEVKRSFRNCYYASMTLTAC